MNALPMALAAGLGLLLLSSKRRNGTTTPADDDDGEPSVEEEVTRIVQESKEIVQGKRDEYSDKPGQKVSQREAAERVKETIDTAKANTSTATSSADDSLAIAAAREAKEAEAVTATSPTTNTTAKPATEVVDVKQAQQWLNYLGAGVAVDGKYGPITKAAWEKAARDRKVNGSFAKATATRATVTRAAANAIRADAAKAKEAKQKAKVTTDKVNATASPAAGPTPPEGFDRKKAANAAPDVAKNIKNKAYNYSRPALKIWQKLAGIAQDGIYGKGSAAALRYYVGPTAPKALFAQGEDHYPWGN